MALPDSISSVKNLFMPVKVDQREIMDIWSSWQMSSEIIDKIKGLGTVDVEENDSWHSISELVYGTREYWWVLVLFNEVEDPFSLFFDSTMPETVTRIKVIKPEFINLVVTEIRNQRIEKEANRFDA
jgi:hypothetical protein